MPTTTIRIESELKARLAAAAARAGKSTHAFILDAITSTLEQDEWEVEFHRIADERWSHVLSSGETVSWQDAKAWIEARSRGEHAPRPEPRNPRR